MNIAVLEGYVCNPGDLSWEVFEQFGTVRVYDRTFRRQLTERMADVDIAVCTKVIWDEWAFEQSPNLKLIALAATGYNVVDMDAARAHGVTICNVPAYSTPDVAQMTFALLLELCMRVGHHTQLVMDGEWVRANDFCFYSTPLVELSGKTMGIVGMGSIGQAVARIARAFGMDVLFCNRSPKPELETPANGEAAESKSEGSAARQTVVRQVELDELLRTSDIMSLHTPLTPQTEHMIDAEAIAKMKDGALLINTARGTLVDEAAVADALRSGKLSGFGADVASREPMRPDNPLLNVRNLNVAITPHIAWGTREARARLLDEVAKNVAAYLAGAPTNVVS